MSSFLWKKYPDGTRLAVICAKFCISTGLHYENPVDTKVDDQRVEI